MVEAVNAESTRKAESDDEKAKARKTTDKKEKGPFVKYLGVLQGVSSAREITAREWLQLGIKTKGIDVWDLRNDFQLPASQFDDDQLDYLLDVDGRFALVDAEGKEVER